MKLSVVQYFDIVLKSSTHVFTCFYVLHRACFCLMTLTGLNMVELASLNIVVDRVDIHAWTNRLEQRCWNHHDKSTAMFMHDRTCCHWMIKFQIEQRCYNNRELGCCIKSGFACSSKREQPLSIPQAVYNMLKYTAIYSCIQYVDSTILLFHQSCSIMLTVLLQGCWANNPVVDWYFTYVQTEILISWLIIC